MKLELKLETAEDVKDIAIKVNYQNKKSEVVNLKPSAEKPQQVTKTQPKPEEPKKITQAPKEFTNFRV